MDVLKRFDRLRPDDEYLNDATRGRVWSRVSATGSGTADLDAIRQEVVEADRGGQAPLVAIQPNRPG